jgi:hypothetical protein
VGVGYFSVVYLKAQYGSPHYHALIFKLIALPRLVHHLQAAACDGRDQCLPGVKLVTVVPQRPLVPNYLQVALLK